MSLEAVPRERCTYKRKSLNQMSDATLGDFFQKPDSLVVPADIASATPLRSYKSIKRAIDNGHLREPVRLPNGRHVWRAGDVLHDLGLEQLRPAARSETGVECTADDEDRADLGDGPSHRTKYQTTESHRSRDRNGGTAVQ